MPAVKTMEVVNVQTTGLERYTFVLPVHWGSTSFMRTSTTCYGVGSAHFGAGTGSLRLDADTGSGKMKLWLSNTKISKDGTGRQGSFPSAVVCAPCSGPWVWEPERDERPLDEITD